MMTTEQTKQAVRDGMAELKDEDIVEIVTEACATDEALTDEMFASLEKLSFD
jgi:hypothetical protein